jgi:lipid II:glycine glycyltransferase (peptidoglycan interpeptide bridge formation enzyme)
MARRREIPYSREVDGYSVSVSDRPDDAAWDDFLELSPMGHHAQTSCWGRARASIGWLPIRVVVSEEGQVAGGAQMVTRPMPFGGTIGFVHRGPVAPEDRPDLVALVFDELLAIGRTRRVRYLVVQPPPGAHWMTGELKARDFGYGAFDIDHTSTLRLDLQPGLDGVLRKMTKKMRRCIQSEGTSGITVRQGSEVDLPIFNRLKAAHSARLGYSRRGEGYYAEVWRALEPRGHIALFIAEYGDEPVSALLVIPFRDTCRHMERAWSGEHAKQTPNELLEWAGIKWAHAHGSRFIDWEGIETPLADAILSGAGTPVGQEFSASRFKLKFGGAVVVDPSSYDYVFNPVMRFAYRCIPTRVMRSRWMTRVVFRFRATGS